MLRLCLPFALLATPALADDPVIQNVSARNTGGSWSFTVTIRHQDTGRDDYADGWEVVAPDGTRLGYRELLHPHVDEQPFTRSLSGVSVPADTTHVTIRVHTNAHGWGAQVVRVGVN